MTGIGPDSLIEAPLVELGETMRVDGVPVPDGEALGDILKNKRELWMFRNPRNAFPGVIVADVMPNLPIERLAALLASIRASGNPNIWFLLSDVHTEERPLLGRIVGVFRSTAIARVATTEIDCDPR